MADQQTQQITPAQVAQICLATMDKAQISADDATLTLVQAARQMLRGIASGQLSVVQTAQPAAPAAPTPADPPAKPTTVTAAVRAAVRGSEGVVAPPAHPLVKPRARKSK